MSFYNLVSDQNAASLEDNKVKSDVNSLRSLINSTNYKTRFIIVLVADGPISQGDLEERLVNIRRGTNFDSKALYFLPSASSSAEVQDFAKVLLSTLHPTSIEYYRDLSKHARRKRNRNVVPQPTLPPTQGTSSILTLQGWHVRYEFKLAVFAEQRQEMEAASRNYEAAYDGLFSGELFDSIPAWSIRFNEARMLADVIAIRIIRCFLWSSQSTAAVRWWSKHKERMRDLVDRRGKGTETYGWQAWCGIWSKIMSELIERAEIFPATASRLSATGELPVQLVSERELAAAEKQAPWESLHHEGYWLINVANHVEDRRRLAMQIPLEDRVNTQSSKTSANKRVHLYENYLVPDPTREYAMLEMPEVGYSKRFAEAIDSSMQAFRRRNQNYMIEQLEQRLSYETVKKKAWSEGIAKMKSRWYETAWRQSGWWLLLSRIATLLQEAALEVQDYELCLRLAWEAAGLQDRKSISLDQLTSAGSISTAVDLKVCLPQLRPNFAFAIDTGRVGEPVAAQLSITCDVDILPLKMQIGELKILFDGGMNPIVLTNTKLQERKPDSSSIEMIDVQLAEMNTDSIKQSKRLSMTSLSIFAAQTDLNLHRKGTRILNLNIAPREAGPVAVSSIVLLMSNGTQEIALGCQELAPDDGVWWESRNGAPVSRAFGGLRDVTSINVLPKPPKVDINMIDLAKAYYTNENVEINLQVVNGESEVVHAELVAHIISPGRENLEIRWKHDETPVSLKDGDLKEATLPAIRLEGLAPGANAQYALIMTGLDESVDHEIELRVSYMLASDDTNPLVKQITIDVPVVRPFEATTLLHPRYHADAWPDFFAAPNTLEAVHAGGLKQQYLARTEIGCFAQETLRIHSLELKARRVVGGAVFIASKGRMQPSILKSEEIDVTKGAHIQSERTELFVFDVELQKMILGDRSPVALDCAVDISWSRVGSESINISTLPLAKFLAPMSEPRVLLQAVEIVEQAGMYLLTYTVENPSMHFLTFNIAMTGGEDIAFSGPKMKTISLVPISRYDLRYRIFTQKKKDWVKVQLDVVDAVFQQHLRVQPVTDNVRSDKQGIVQLRVE